MNLSLHYHELTGKMKENEGEEYMMVNDCTLDKVLDTIKETIDIEKIDDPKILFDNKLPDDITLKKCCDINDMPCETSG